MTGNLVEPDFDPGANVLKLHQVSMGLVHGKIWFAAPIRI